MTKLRYFGAILALCAVVCGFAPGAHAQGGVAAQTFTPWRTVGNALYTAPGASVTVCSNTALVTNGVCAPAENDGNCCFTDATLTVHIPANPFTVGGDGNVSPFFAAPGTYQVSVSGAGLTAKTYPVTVAGTGGGNVVLSASNAFIGNNSHAGTETFTGPVNTKLFESAQVVDSSLSRGGVDVCDEINKAYAALPSTGGAIWLFANNSGTPYNCTTPIVFGTAGKYALLESVMVAAAINWTPSTGTVITVNTGSSNQHYQSSLIHGIVLTGPGSGTSSTGILYGTSLGDEALLDSSTVYNFGTGVTWNNYFRSTIDHSSIVGNGIGVSLPLNGELNSITNSVVANNGTAVSMTGTAIDLSITTVSMDSNSTCAITASGSGSGAVYATNIHWENAGLGTACYVSDTHSGSNWTWHISGGQMLDDVTTSTLGQMMTFGSGDLNIDGLNIFSAGRTLTQIINTSSSFTEAKISLIKTGSAAGRPSIAGSISAANVMDCSPDNSAAFLCKLPAIQVAGGTTLAKYSRFSVSLSPVAVAANTCAAQSFTVTGVAGADILISVSKPTEQAGLSVGLGHVTGANTATINFCNNTAAPITPTAAETYQFVTVQ